MIYNKKQSIFNMNSDPEHKAMIGRANRLLHWDDFLYFRQKSLLFYDLGDWYGGKTDRDKLLINEFKESFGGEKKEDYVYTVPVSFLSYIWVFIRSIKYFIQKFRYNLTKGNITLFKKSQKNNNA